MCGERKDAVSVIWGCMGGGRAVSGGVGAGAGCGWVSRARLGLGAERGLTG